MFFLTEVDAERLKIRGSRDPLGLIPLWGTFGRKVVGNLTTASNSVRGFTTLLLGFYFAEELAQGSDREATRLATVLKVEQLAGYARWLRNQDGDLRGITEVRNRTQDNPRKVTLGVEQKFQILSNQKTYGLWGLFSVAARESALLERQELILTPAARQLVENEYLPAFRKHGFGDARKLNALLGRDRVELEPSGRHAALFDALGAILRKTVRQREHAVYYEHLVLGGPKGREAGWQPEFAELLEATAEPDAPFSKDLLVQIIRRAKDRRATADLVSHLEEIRDLESVLTAMGNLFAFLQQRDRASLREVTAQVGKVWRPALTHLRPGSIETIKDRIAKVFDDAKAGDRFSEFTAAAAAGDIARAIELVLDQNRQVMKARHGAQPWVELQRGRFEVRYRDDASVELAPPKELAERWESTFYLDPLKTLSDQLRNVT